MELIKSINGLSIDIECLNLLLDAVSVYSSEDALNVGQGH